MSDIERLPPHSAEAEEAVLGSLLIDPDAIFDVSAFLRPEAFYRVKNKWIYEAILSLSERREPLDLITVTEELRRREQLEEIGGEAFVISLINMVPTSINARSYARVVEATATRRKMISAASTIANLAYDEAENVNVVIDRAEQALFSISEERTTRDLTPIKQIASTYLERIQELNARGDDVIGVPTGFVDLDRLLGGLNKSDLIIVAARPGMGKCLTADSHIVDPQTGDLRTIESVVKMQEAHLLTLDNHYKLQTAQASDFVDDGIKLVYQVRTALGREIKTTLSHPFLTINGWQPLYNLTIGDRVAVPRCIPVFGHEDAPDYEVKTLAYLIGDGALMGSSPQFTNSNPCLREDFAQAALQFPGNKARLVNYNGRRTPTIYITQDTSFPPADRDTFVHRLKTVMEETAVPCSELAQTLQVSYGAVQQWRSGKNYPSPQNFQNLCQALDVTETYLAPGGHAQASQISNTLTHWLKEIGIWGKMAVEKDIPAIVFRYPTPPVSSFPQPALCLRWQHLFTEQESTYCLLFNILPNVSCLAVSFTTALRHHRQTAPAPDQVQRFNPSRLPTAHHRLHQHLHVHQRNRRIW